MADVDVDRLPPTQYLILEVLAARARTGEHLWSFPDRLRPALRELTMAGLIGWKSSPAPNTCHVWFTVAGRKLFVLDDFMPPAARELAAAQRTAAEAVERQLELARELEQLRAHLEDLALREQWAALYPDGTWTSGEEESRAEAEEIVAGSRSGEPLRLARRWVSDWQLAGSETSP